MHTSPWMHPTDISACALCNSLSSAILALFPHMAAVPSLSEPQRSGDSHPAVSHLVQKLVEEVLAWQRRNGVQKFPANTPVIARSASSHSGLRNCCFAVTRLWVQSKVGHSYRHLKWLWSIQCPVYLFVDARQQLSAAAPWLNNFLKVLP